MKSHFSAAEAVIPCCQSPLYCRSCICSSLVLSIDGVGAAGASTGTIMPLHKPAKNCISLHMDQRFLDAKGEERLNKYVYPHRLWTSTFHANARLHSAYSYIFMQMRCAGHTLSALAYPQYPFCLFGLGFWFRAEIMLAEKKVSNQNPFALNMQTGLCLKTSSKTFRDVSAIDSEYFVFLPNTMRRAQRLFHKAASCHTFDCCCSEAHRLNTSNSDCLVLGSTTAYV